MSILACLQTTRCFVSRQRICVINAISGTSSRRLAHQDSDAMKYTITEPVEELEIVKKSKFYAKAFPASSIDEAMAHLARVSDPKASHNCWAFRGFHYERSSDDGEPSGTAGKPILNAIESENVYDVMVIVTRFFGGTKLGTGGLVRSYFSSAQLALKKAEKVIVTPSSVVRMTSSIEDYGNMNQLVTYFNSNINSNRDPAMPPREILRLEETFDDADETMSLLLKVPAEIVVEMKTRFQDACKGGGNFEELVEESVDAS